MPHEMPTLLKANVHVQEVQSIVLRVGQSLSYSSMVSILLLSCLVWLFETGYHSVVLTGLELTHCVSQAGILRLCTPEH